MSRATANPDAVITLTQWASRYGKANNVGFEATSREPTVYKPGTKTIAKTFQWVREGDVMTILSNPTQFSNSVVAAKTVYTDIHDRTAAGVAQEVNELQRAERDLMEQWRQYYAAPPEARAGMIRGILAAESSMRAVEASLGTVQYPERRLYKFDIKGETFRTAHVPAIPTANRGLPLSAVAEASGQT